MRLKKASGYSLMEVLLSLTLLSFALLGMDAMEADALQASHASYLFSMAEMQMLAITERLRVLGPKTGITALQAQWHQENAVLLPRSREQILGVFPHYVITLFWGMPQRTCDTLKRGHSGCLKESITL